ncbi:MAG: hypothetical protein Q9M36_09105 [Sulfurovum sp.]|nr:hypothetical protein [Sulfurovum sp.]
MKSFPFYALFIFIALLFTGCNSTQKLQPKIQAKKPPKKTFTMQKKTFHLVVTATAYTSRKSETDSTPYIGAWNNRLSTTHKSIAVSRDLIKKGLGNGTRVRIRGLRGIYTVRDKMHKKWRRKIDIYMGTNLKKALQWGRRKVTLSWTKKVLTPLPN